MDEPFAALDVPTRVRLRRDIRALLKRTGTPAVLVTHDRVEALAMGDLVAVVIAGRVRQVDVTSDVFGRPADVDVAASIGVEAVLPARIIAASEGHLDPLGERASNCTSRSASRATPGTDVYACIRAEDVTLELQSPADASARNHLPRARHGDRLRRGQWNAVSLDCGFPPGRPHHTPLARKTQTRARHGSDRRNQGDLGAPGTQVLSSIDTLTVSLR